MEKKEGRRRTIRWWDEGQLKGGLRERKGEEGRTKEEEMMVEQRTAFTGKKSEKRRKDEGGRYDGGMKDSLKED